MQETKTITLTSMILLISACSGLPPQITASVPLVINTEHSYPKIKNDALALLEPAKAQRTHTKSSSYIIENRYISALGYQCAKLKRLNAGNTMNHLIACNIQDVWRELPSIEPK